MFRKTAAENTVCISEDGILAPYLHYSHLQIGSDEADSMQQPVLRRNSGACVLMLWMSMNCLSVCAVKLHAHIFELRINSEQTEKISTVGTKDECVSSEENCAEKQKAELIILAALNKNHVRASLRTANMDCVTVHCSMQIKWIFLKEILNSREQNSG